MFTDATDSGDGFSGTADALARWDDNRNGRISCKEARHHHIAPVRRGHPAYPFMRNSDGGGVRMRPGQMRTRKNATCRG